VIPSLVEKDLGTPRAQSLTAERGARGHPLDHLQTEQQVDDQDRGEARQKTRAAPATAADAPTAV